METNEKAQNSTVRVNFDRLTMDTLVNIKGHLNPDGKTAITTKSDLVNEVSNLFASMPIPSEADALVGFIKRFEEEEHELRCIHREKEQANNSNDTDQGF